MFVKNFVKVCATLMVYVGDIVISGSDVVGIKETKEWLKSKLHIKDLG